MTAAEEGRTILIQLTISRGQSPTLHAALLGLSPGRARTSRLRELALQGLALETLVVHGMGVAPASIATPETPRGGRAGSSSEPAGAVPAPGALAGTLEWSFDQG